MSLASAFLVLTLVWTVIYALHYLLKWSSNHSLLPATTTTGHTRRRIWSADSTTTVVLKGLHLRVQTTALNLSHDLLASSLASSQKAYLRRALNHLYDAGAVISLLGMLLALGFLFFTSATSAVSIIQKLYNSVSPASSPVSQGLRNFGKRTIDASSSLAPTNDPFIKPIIPGITVPLSHLPIILVAVFFAQIIHELGHAIAAAIEQLPILSVGMSFTIFFPSAFVTFSNVTLEGLIPRARARIIAAGAFHNILLWGLLLAIGYARLGDLFWSIGYKDVSAQGRVVVDVDTRSPLYNHLPLGSLITALDDISLGSHNASYDDGWSSYLNRNRHEQSLGWCASLPDLNTCCSGSRILGMSCFTSLDNPTLKGCLDPVPLLTHVDAAKRCTTDDQCSTTQKCVKPDPSEQLLRIKVQGPAREGADILLWRGPAEEIWEEVRVGTLSPKIAFLGVSLPYTAQVFWEYLAMATLSLFFFNLLPLLYLDGSQFFKAIVSMWSSDPSQEIQDEYELEAFEEVRRLPRSVRWWEALSGLVPELTMVLIAVCTLLGFADVYWQ